MPRVLIPKKLKMMGSMKGVGEREMWQRFQCDNRYLWISDPSKSGILSTRRSKLKT